MDSNQQYQDILDQYQKTFSNPPSPSVPAPPQPLESVPPSPVPPPSPVLLPPVSPPPISPPPQPVLPPPPPVQALTKPSKDSTIFFKILFILSFLLFLGVAAAVVYNLLSQQLGSNPLPIKKITTTPSETPTQAVSFCELNDQRYQVGQSFPAADGCNTCTCLEDLTISCTELSCDITPAVSPVNGS